MNQPCLAGLCCRDMILKSEADRLGLTYDCACNANDSGCGCPDKSALALEQWQECSDEGLLDLVGPQRLPRLIPCVPNLQPRENSLRYRHFSILAAKASDIGGIHSRNIALLGKWRGHYQVDAAPTLMVHQESRDELQDRFYTLLREDETFRLLLALGKLIFVPPGLSVYDDGSMCPLRQVLNMRMSLRLAARANRLGLPTIPVFGWNHYRDQDIQFLVEWCIRQGDRLQGIAVNAQTGNLTTELRNLAIGMARIERESGREYKWVVFGGRQRIEQLTEFIPRSRVVQVAREKDFQVPIRDRSGRLSVQFQLLNGGIAR